VALDATGLPSFNALQNGTTGAAIFFYVFDVMILGGRNAIGETLVKRRDILTREVLPRLADPVREAPRFDASLAALVAPHDRFSAWPSHEEMKRRAHP
jgi:ATP-dependent DNA ligase